MRAHGDGGEEIRGSPLHIDTLQGIGIVAHPKLVEPRQYPPVGTGTTGSTGLNSQVRILLAYVLTYFLEATVIFYISMALVALRQILRSVVLYTHVGIPLDVVDVGILCHQLIHNIKSKVLHFGVSEIKY